METGQPMIHVSLSDGRETFDYRVPSDNVCVIGTAMDAEIMLARGAGLGRRHLKLVFRDDGVLVEDLHPELGATLDGERIGRRNVGFGRHTLDIAGRAFVLDLAQER